MTDVEDADYWWTAVTGSGEYADPDRWWPSSKPSWTSHSRWT